MRLAGRENERNCLSRNKKGEARDNRRSRHTCKRRGNPVVFLDEQRKRNDQKSVRHRFWGEKRGPETVLLNARDVGAI